MRPVRLGGAFLLGLAASLILAERRRPLRPRLEDADRHDLRNLLIGALSAATVTLLQTPLAAPLARAVERRRWGLAQQAPLPAWACTALAVVLMDYSLYGWHVLTHRVPLLWRFHAVHHADRDLTATTALRFHFAEMALSVPYRAAQVLALGAGPAALRLWQALTLAAILFHHSNLRLPARLERALGWLVTTPRMHGVHHSAEPAERDSNWSSGLSLWDRLHGTLRTGPPQAAIIIGVRGLDRTLALPEALALPFRPSGRSGRRSPPWPAPSAGC